MSGNRIQVHTEQSIDREIWGLLWPLLILTAIQRLGSMFEGVLVSVNSTDELTITSFCAPYINLISTISYGIGIGEWLRATASSNYLFLPDSTRGQSYLIGYDVKPVDVMDFYSEYEDDIGGTFVIKALCSSDEAEGDVDRDGEFGITDVTCTQRMLAEMITLNKTQMRFADFNNDGESDITDATRMQRSLAGFENV